MVRPGTGYVKTRLELGRIEDKCQWDWGELADEVGDSLNDYASKIGRSYNTLKEYRRVHSSYPKGMRCLLHGERRQDHKISEVG